MDMNAIIEDLIKGAEEAGGFMRGSRAKVERQFDRGHEEKLASGGSTGSGLAHLLGGSPLSSALTGAVGAGYEDGSGLSALGAGGGSLGGSALGSALGGLIGHPEIGSMLGGMGGAAAGQALLQPKPHGLKEKLIQKLSAAHDAGTKAACARYKVAFLGALASMGANLGGTALAGKALGSAAKGIGGQMLAGGAGMAAQAGVDRLMQPKQQPQQRGF